MTQHRSGAPSWVTGPATVPLSTMTCAVDGHAHLVADPELGSGVSRGDGTYRAVCGRRVVAVSLSTPPGPACPACSDR
jgi:hypothetical protein